MDSAYRRAVEEHNQKAAQNRYVLNIIINCIRFCGAFELALRGHDESDTSNNPGIFRGLINFSSELDSVLKNHLENATVFKGTSKMIQNEILECILEVCREEISKEIKDSPFLSIIADETGDVNNKYQMVIVYRYLVNFKPVERYWGFVIPEGQKAENLAACILANLEQHLKGCKNKLIAQTYDGANVMSGAKHGVQAVVKEKYKSAEYIHCHAHQLNLTMLRASSSNPSVRVFFINLQGICAFFSNSPQRTAVLDEVVQKRLPRSVPTRWNFQSRSVNTVFEHREELIDCMKLIQQGNRVTNESSILQASGFIGILNDSNFVFWLNMFHKIMPHVDMLYNQLQRRDCTPSLVQSKISSFELEILRIRSNIDLASCSGNLTKRRKNEQFERKREALEVCDIVLAEIKDIFKFSGHLGAANLFQSEKFADYNENFPEQQVKFALETYKFVEEKKLHTELSTIYSTEEFRNISGAVSLMEFFRDNNLCSTFSESVKLLNVILTIPMTTCEAERSFSTLKRIKTFLRNTMSEERLCALAMLSIERDFILNMRDFNERVIEKFVTGKERRVDFLYK